MTQTLPGAAGRCPNGRLQQGLRCFRQTVQLRLIHCAQAHLPSLTILHRKPVSAPLLAAILAGLAMLGPFSIDTYLPSFPAIAGDFSITALQLQQTLSAYLLPFAFMTLFHGTLSDSFGRRPVILVSLVCFALGSVGCAMAQSYEQLLLFRGAQGLSAGAGMVVGRAIIRDSFEGHAAQRLMSMVTMIFGLAPAIAPVIGGLLQSWFGWRAVFVFLALFGAALYLLCHLRLPETLPPSSRQPFAVVPLFRNYVKLAGSLRLFLLSSAVALNFCGFFLYIASAPALIYGLLGLGENQFARLFVPGIAGVMMGAFLSGRLAGRASPQRTVKIAYGLMFSAAALNLAYSGFFEPALPWTVLPVMLYSMGMALGMPSVTLLALDLFPHNRGMAASLQGFEQSFLSGIVAGFVSPLLSHADLALAGGMAGLLLLGWLAWMMYLRIGGVTQSAAPPHA
jgi:DHA1 family bicyclomycin/chloramphenicol resistance-like MFS transporter